MIAGIDHIWHYLRGERNGKTANRLERDALSDPFLYEAIEGMSGVDADHKTVVESLGRRLREKEKPKSNRVLYRWLAAASFLLVVGVAAWLASVPEVEMTDQFAVVQAVDSAFEVEPLITSATIPVALDSGKEDRQMEESSIPAVLQTSSKTRSQAIASEKKAYIEGTEGNQQKQFGEKGLPTGRKGDSRSDRSVDTVHGKKAGEGIIDERLVSARVNTLTKKSVRIGEAQTWQQRFESYVADSLRYPVEARKAKIQGDVLISVRLNKRGHPARIKIIKELSPACDREAMRLVEFYGGTLGDRKNQRIELTVSFRLKTAD